MLLTAFRAPGTGRRQAEPSERLKAENVRLHRRIAALEETAASDHAALQQTAFELGETVHELAAEQAEHDKTMRLLDAAVATNDTLQTAYTAGPQHRRAMPLWEAPFATTDPAGIPGGVR